jgi:hypothetical protein
MKIYFERSGGITGTHITLTIDTKLLPPEEVRKIQNILDDMDFFDLPSKYLPPKQGADLYQYNITVDTEQRKHSVEISSFPIPSELRPLIEYLSSKITKR